MHRIYFENRCIILINPDEPTLADPNAVEFLIKDKFDIRTIVNMFEISNTILRTYIPTDDLEETYKRLCSEFKEVEAAGGLVINKRSDFLLIKRNGLWDLPKGHREKGESMETTALREVEEETGVTNLTLGDLITVTDHCYKRDGIWHLKHTWWYKMYYNEQPELTPQREEDIMKAAWVSKTSLPPFLKNTFPSIMEVFREAKI